MSARPKDAQESAELLLRVEELEAAIATALKVNKLLNQEVEKYVLSSDKLSAERDAWQRHARNLAQQHNALKKQQAGVTDDVEDLAAYLELQEQQSNANEQPSTSGMVVEPTPMQLKAISTLLSRGKLAGWLIDPSEVVKGAVLGQGAFGTTFRGTWRGAEVAVKCVRVSKHSELTTFLREVEAMSLVRHPNVVPFLGACMRLPDCFWLLAEYMPGGTMDKWMRPSGSNGTSNACPRSLAERARAGLQVAQGMQALHGQSPCIMHRDLKPSNLFMDGGGNVRVADFGLARRLQPNESRATLTGETGTYLYMAPEVMRHDVYDLKCDVWSWGVLFAELMDGGQTPYWHTYMTPVQIALAVAEERLQPHLPEHLPTDLQVIGRMACQFDPDARPSFDMIISELAPAVAKEMEQAGKRDTFLDQLARFTSSWGGIMGRAIYGATQQQGNAPAPPTQGQSKLTA